MDSVGEREGHKTLAFKVTILLGFTECLTVNPRSNNWATPDYVHVHVDVAYGGHVRWTTHPKSCPRET